MQPGARGAAVEVRDGGMFRISLGSLDYVDPALAYSFTSWSLIDTTCARLMTHPDRPPPEGYRVVPEVAAAYPRVSRDGKTWTFTLRSGFRFSDGKPVRASAFARAIARTLAPGVDSPAVAYTREIVGAADVQAGRTASPAGVVARGNRLVVRFTRPVADFPAQTTMPFFCAVPPTLPADPEGVGAFPGAGPYFVAEYRARQRVVIRRNRFYRGTRPHHVDGFVVDLTASSGHEVIERVARGEADWGNAPAPFFFDPAHRLVARFGVNRSQFFVKPGLTITNFSLNTSRPLFRDNPRLRQAVNFAVDRAALVRVEGTTLFARATDQYLPRGLPGFNDARIYPFTPDLQTARALARGNTRGGRAVLYAFDFPAALARAQIVAQNLAKIGLDVEVKGIGVAGYFGRLTAPDEPFDIALTPWQPDYLDPFTYVNFLLDGRYIGLENHGRFNSATYNARMRSAARLQGAERYRAYGRLDVELSRDAAPRVPVFVQNQSTLVSARVGCVVLRPTLDLTAVCLKQ
jgi:peptide/nickel transport system substrate-binding protein